MEDDRRDDYRIGSPMFWVAAGICIIILIAMWLVTYEMWTVFIVILSVYSIVGVATGAVYTSDGVWPHSNVFKTVIIWLLCGPIFWIGSGIVWLAILGHRWLKR